MYPCIQCHDNCFGSNTLADAVLLPVPRLCSTVFIALCTGIVLMLVKREANLRCR